MTQDGSAQGPQPSSAAGFPGSSASRAPLGAGLRGRRCLVTGSSGVIGRALTRTLIDCGADVIAADRRPAPFGVAPEGLQTQLVDLLDQRSYSSLVRGCDSVFHLAARLPQAKLDEAGFHRENVEMSQNLHQVCAAEGVRRFVFASTIEVYGVQKITEPLDEDDATLFTGSYSRNKWELEQELLNSSGVETVALRMPMVFGPGFYHEKTVLALFMLLRAGLPIPVTAPHVPVSFVSSSDAAQAFVLAATERQAPRQAFNVAAEDHPKMRDFFCELARRSGSRSRPLVISPSVVHAVVQAAQRKGSNGRSRLTGTPAELVAYIETGGAYSIEKARKLLDFVPQDSCADAWIRTYRWFWSQPWSERYRVAFIARG